MRVLSYTHPGYYFPFEHAAGNTRVQGNDKVSTGHDQLSELLSVRPGSDGVLHMSRIEFQFRPTQINLDRLN